MSSHYKGQKDKGWRKKQNKRYYEKKKEHSNFPKKLQISTGQALLEDEEAEIGTKEIKYEIQDEKGNKEIVYSSNKRLKETLRYLQRQEEYERKFPKIKFIGKENKKKRENKHFNGQHLNAHRYWSTKQDKIIYSNRFDKLMLSEKRKICRKCGFQGHDGSNCNMWRCRNCNKFHENKVCTYVYPDIDY